MTPISDLLFRLETIKIGFVYQNVVNDAQTVIDRMMDHLLEGDSIEITNGCEIVFRWERIVGSEVRKAHLCCARDFRLGSTDDGTDFNIWSLIMGDEPPSKERVSLTLDESLEYIRHFIWAEKS